MVSFTRSFHGIVSPLFLVEHWNSAGVRRKKSADERYRQNLLSSAMMASAPRYEPGPYCLLVRGDLPYSDPVLSEIGLSPDFCWQVATTFQNMRYLTQTLDNWNGSQTALETMSFTKTRTYISQRLLSLANNKQALEMTNLDYTVEICRLAALIYIRFVLDTETALCATVRSLSSQLMQLIRKGEANGTIGVGARKQPVSGTWALFVVGSLTVNEEEQEWFAQRLAKGIRGSGVETWPEMERRLRQICWLDKLNTSTCRNLWGRIMAIHAEYSSAQVGRIVPNWGRQNPFYWSHGYWEKADTSSGIDMEVLGSNDAPKMVFAG